MDYSHRDDFYARYISMLHLQFNKSNYYYQFYIVITIFILLDIKDKFNIFSQFIFMIQESGSFGYKVKVIGSIMFNVLPLYFHCHMGEVVLTMVRT